MLNRHREKKAEKEYLTAHAAWQEQRDACVALVQLAQTYRGEAASDILLKPAEAVFAQVQDASLIEDRRGPSEWRGRSQGFSIPVGSIGGRSIRYRVGRTRGHVVQGSPSPTAIDRGIAFVTNQRVIFQGSKQTRECRFDKLLGFAHDDASGRTTFSVSNRQTPTCIGYGPALSGWFDFRLDLAIAHYRNAVAALIEQLQQDMATLDASEPVPPPPPTN